MQPSHVTGQGEPYIAKAGVLACRKAGSRYFRIFITLSGKITSKVVWVAVTGENVADRQTDRQGDYLTPCAYAHGVLPISLHKAFTTARPFMHTSQYVHTVITHPSRKTLQLHILPVNTHHYGNLHLLHHALKFNHFNHALWVAAWCEYDVKWAEQAKPRPQ